MIFPVRSYRLPGWEQMTQVKTPGDNKQIKKKNPHSLHLGSNLYQRFRWSGSLETSAFDSRKTAQLNESLQNLLRINWTRPHRLCFDGVWSGKSWLWKGLGCDPSAPCPRVQLDLLPWQQDHPHKLCWEGRAGAHLLHRGSWKESFFSEQLAIYTPRDAELSSRVWGQRGYHFSSFLPVTPQTTWENKAETEELCLVRVIFLHSAWDSLWQSKKKIILCFFQTPYPSMPFSSTTEINPAKRQLLSLPCGLCLLPCLTHPGISPGIR